MNLYLTPKYVLNSLSSSVLQDFTQDCILLLQKCMKAKSLKACLQIHASIITHGIDVSYFSLSSKLIGTYACCGDLTASRLLFKRTPNPNVFAFNWLILTLTFSGFHGEAIEYFSSLLKSRNSYSLVNKQTFSSVLKGSVGLLDLTLGSQLHGMIIKMGFDTDVSVCNALIDMYRKCGAMSYSCKVFDGMTERDVVSWTSIISGYCDEGMIGKSIEFFERMRREGVKANEFTWNAIIAGHARSGDLHGACELFSRMSKAGLIPDLATWNGIISGLVQSRRCSKAMELFHDMLLAGVKPNSVTMTGLIPVCGTTGSIFRGREIHGLIHRMGIPLNAFVASALIDMYSKCGSIKEAWNVFNTTDSKNTASWNAMIGCYGKHGMADSAIHLFERMQKEGIEANELTLNSLLCACDHAGQVEKGMEFFSSMGSYLIEANKKHYACVVDLLCRFGKMEEAYYVVKHMPVEATGSMTGAFLNGCKIHERSDLARKLCEHLRIELKSRGDFVTLSNIYASEGKWEGVLDLREVMKDKSFRKKSGFSSV